MSEGYKTFNDCVHGYITLHPVCVKIIDTPEFQRLRNLKQVGPVYFVYPGASHNRFEHSLGVCHLAGKMVEALRRNSDDKNVITDDEKLCLEIAGLCHDLGHGPFSHMWESFVEYSRSEEDASVKWRHEDSSVQMFEYLLKQNNLHSVLMKAFPELREKGIELIKELIRGEGTQTVHKKYLYQIISNKETGIDVDRWDYIFRDGRQLNISFSFDFHRLLEFCSVNEVHGQKIICFDSKERLNVYDMFYARVTLYHKAYCHNVVKCVEEMFIDALIEADRNGYKICVPSGKEYQLSQAHNHVEALNHMTDHIFYDILYSTKEDFKEARQLLHRILHRDLYKIVACKNLSAKLMNKKVTLTEMELDGKEFDKKVREEIGCYKQDIEADLKNISKSMHHCKFEQFKVQMIMLDMRTEGQIKPFSNICFYKKKNLEKAREMEWKEIYLLPIPEESVCLIHGLVIYKDRGNPVSKNGALQEELQILTDKLNRLWQD